MTTKEIQTTVLSLGVGDLVAVNDWKKPMTVRGTSERYVLASNSDGEYTIFDKEPNTILHNCIPAGAMVCGPDDLIFGYIDGYHFDDAGWVKEYLQDLETEQMAISLRRRAAIYNISILA